MNLVVIAGRLTKDPDVRYSQGDSTMAIGKYTLAVDRKGKDAGTDFINIVAFGKGGEFAEKYLKKGMKVLVTGRIQTGSFTNRDGVKVYTTDVVAEDQEFCEKKEASERAASNTPTDADGFMNIPDDDDLPFGPVTR